MNRSGLAALALAFAAASTGCLSDSSPLVITGFTQIAPDVSADVCTSTGTTLSAATYDTAIGTLAGIKMAATVENLVQMVEDPDSVRVDTSTAQLDTVLLKYRTAPGAAFMAPPPATLALNASVTGGGSASVIIPLLTQEGADALGLQEGGQLLVDVVLSGHFTDGTAIRTSTATFPLDLCAGCMGRCNPDTEVTLTCGGMQPFTCVAAGG